MAISATGLATGIDVESLVSQLVAAEIAPAANRFDRKESDHQLKISGLGSLRGELTSFLASLSGVGTAATFQSKLASSSLSKAVEASANADATIGSYSIAVSNLATSQSYAQAGTAFSAVTDAVGLGTLAINDGTQTVSVVVDSNNNSLSGLAESINKTAGNVNAAVVYDGTGYRLVLSATKTGQANSLTITAAVDNDGNTSDTNGLSKFASANLSQTVAAEDAALTINGLSVSSASNSISDALTGVTLTLKEETSAGEIAQISVSDDKGKLVAAVSTFVKGYNQVMSSINKLTAYDSSTQRASALTGDAGVRAIASGIRNHINSSVKNVTGDVSMLAELGITSSALTGELTVNNTTLDAAITKNPLDVANVFASIGRPDSTNIKFVSSTSATEVGTYMVTFDSDNSSGTINGVAATYDATEQTLTGAVNSDVEGLVLKLNGNPSGDLGQVYYAKGISSSLESLVKGFLATDGILDARLDGLDSSIKDINKQREALDSKAGALEARYRRQFNGLETIISQMNTTQSFLNSALNQLVDPLAFKK